ncbi:serine protease 53-like [Anopheles maculipalpis]|uniref:serine protease 53-like n=1 Tax=Anopheles maculipalpis TaxID=1496333 RepID=UPI002158FD81|nr:serine protease 53-like [Anopheles maculipalpis]XP_050074274.1 serine protease 53-like [Anopheles maculipalpis]
MGKVISECWGIPMLLMVLFTLQQPATVDASTCGVRRLSPMGLVTKGIKAERGDWPWHAALFARGKKTARPEYKCGGSIISENFILSAAHCIEEPNPERYFVKVGLYQLYNDTDPNVEIYNLFEIILHSKYDSRKFYNDIALMRPDRVISFSTFVIFPICLWPAHNPSLIDVLRQSGIAVGFGFDESHRISETLQQASMKVIEKQKCIEQLPEHVRFLPQDVGKLCAIGTETGANVCSGDSGGGLYFAKDQVWYLRGIVSAAARMDLDNGESSCNAALPATYTDVAQYTSWINAHQRMVDQRNLLKLEDCGMARNSEIPDEMQKPVFNQYPWNVLLEFRQLNKAQIHLVCSGVLVHPRYVLTVGHCIDGIFSNYNLKSVRLGEYNIRTLEDSDAGVTITSQSVDIEQVLFHPSYNQPLYSNNLALLKLKHNADTAKPNIKPICLPSIDDYKESFLTLSGWKRNKYLFPKQERDAMNLSSVANCRSDYEKLGIHLPATEDVLCGVYKARAAGHCHNYATGSPLQYIKRVDNVPRYFLAGMMMFNFPYCRANGSEMFVNLDSASEWIKDTIK